MRSPLLASSLLAAVAIVSANLGSPNLGEARSVVNIAEGALTPVTHTVTNGNVGGVENASGGNHAANHGHRTSKSKSRRRKQKHHKRQQDGPLGEFSDACTYAYIVLLRRALTVVFFLQLDKLTQPAEAALKRTRTMPEVTNLERWCRRLRHYGCCEG